MNREPDDNFAEDEPVRRALRKAPAAEADPAFRERLRRSFLSGEIAAARPEAARRAAAETARPAFPRIRWWLWTPAVVAATAIMIFAFLGRGPAWQIKSFTGSGDVVVRGHAFSPLPAAAWLREVDHGGRLQVPEGMTLDLVSGDVLAVRIAPGSEVTLPRRTNPLLARELYAALRTGGFIVRTGPEFHGRKLIIETQEGRTEIVGTTISVDCGPGFTCVCVLEGTAQVGPDAEHLEPVPSGRRMVLFAGGKPPEPGVIEPSHAAGMEAFCGQCTGAFAE
jgi:ferric-dicitrate binding protein FerR (iron transport regulator)